MFRTLNLTGRFLEGSDCYYKLAGNFEVGPVDAKYPQIKFTIASPSLHIRFSHALGDAFFGLDVVRKFVTPMQTVQKNLKLARLSLIPNIGFAVLHEYTKGSANIGQAPQSLRLASQILASGLNVRKFSFAVSLDLPGNIADDPSPGNSLAVVNVGRTSIENYCTHPGGWSTFLKNRASAFADLLERKPELQLGAPGEVLISSIGSLSKYGFDGEIFHPAKFLMVPTPIYRKCINLVLWRFGELKVCTVCCFREEISEAAKLLSIWRQMEQGGKA